VTDVAAIIERSLSTEGIRSERVTSTDWAVQLKGEKKLSITVLIALRERTVAVESFFIRRPAENHADVYRMLLRCNATLYGVRFALDDLGDVYLVGRFSIDAVTEDELDRVLGVILTTSDAMFMPAIEVGFASYLARDMAWRATQGIPPGPPRTTIGA
jgi:putative sensory transduction regulator